MSIFKVVLMGLGTLLACGLLVAAYLHHRTQSNAQQQIFLAGKVPSPLPNGIYKGTVRDQETLWLGKKFERAQHTGINVFQEGKNAREAFPFKTDVGSGAADKNLQVLKIEYNIPGNPLWLRMVLDEVVEVSPDHYLGKLHVRILPNFSIALGYFELEKTE